MSQLSIPESRIEYLRQRRMQRIEQLKEEAKKLELKPLPKGQSYKAIAISVDAGEVPIETDVFEGIILRCADSDGKTHFHDTVLTDADVSDISALLDELFKAVPVLQKLLEVAEASSWTDLAPGFVQFDPSDFIREMLEWGTIISLAEEAYKTIFLKDGLLRSKLIKPQYGYLDNIKSFFEANCIEHENFLVGVAKDSAPLRVAYRRLELKPEFRTMRTFYTLVSNDLLELSWKWKRFREGDIPWGNIYLARLFPHHHAKILTLEVPSFLEEGLDEVLRVLAALPLRQIPDRFFGFPDPLARAHEFATLRLNVGKAIAREVMQDV